MNTYVESIPYLITLTVLICIYLIKDVVKNFRRHELDSLFALMGVAFGIIMTFMNLRYVSGELFLLSPLIAITSALYLKFRKKIINDKIKSNIYLSKRAFKQINILFWILISLAIACNNLITNYQRPVIFFIIIPLCVALTGLEIIYTDIKSRSLIVYIMIKILVISFILTSSSYYISKYPVGSDPWAHIEYIKNYLHYGKLMVKPGIITVDQYYLNYPISHLFGTITSLILDISVKNAMYIIGSILVFSSIYTYLITKAITNNVNISLFSMLLLSVSSPHIHWGIEVIAMSYGIAIYAILMYIAIAKYNNGAKYKLLSVFFLIIVIWTHTVTSFILLVSILILASSSKVLDYFQKEKSKMFNLNFIVLTLVLLLFHWTDVRYFFLQKIISGLINSLSAESQFLGGSSSSNILGTWSSLYTYLGNLSYIFFGIIGTLYVINERKSAFRNISLISAIVVLYAVTYTFPIFGMQNIVPERWPSFILIIFTIYIAIGFYKFINMISDRKSRICILMTLLFISSFFMITDNGSNKDSPLFGKDSNQRYLWTDSEMCLFTNVNKKYEFTIIADVQSSLRPFETYLQRNINYIKYYELSEDGEMDWKSIDKYLVIWRKISLYRPITVYPRSEVLLGDSFKKELDYTLSCIYDTGEAKAYISHTS